MMIAERRAVAVFALCLFVVFSALLALFLNVPPAAEAAAQNVVTLADEGFEGAFPPAGWTAGGHWGKSNCEVGAGSFSAWIEGSAPAVTCEPLDTIYHPNETGRLAFGPFDLSDAVAATLSFDLWLWQAAGDTFSWGASTDGVTFSGITVTDAFSTTWESHALDLAAVPGLGDLRGEPNVWIAFSWQTDDFAETFTGAVVDQVRIEKRLADDGTHTPTPTSTATRTPTNTPTNTPAASVTAQLHLPLVSRPAAATSTPTTTPTTTPTSTPTSTSSVTPLPPELTAYALGTDFTDTGTDCAIVGAKIPPITYPPGTEQIAFRLAFDLDQFHGNYKIEYKGDFGGAVTGTSCQKFAIVGGSPRLAQLAVRTVRNDGGPLAPGSYRLEVSFNGVVKLEVPFTIE